MKRIEQKANRRCRVVRHGATTRPPSCASTSRKVARREWLQQMQPARRPNARLPDRSQVSHHAGATKAVDRLAAFIFLGPATVPAVQIESIALSLISGLAQTETSLTDCAAEERYRVVDDYVCNSTRPKERTMKTIAIALAAVALIASPPAFAKGKQHHHQQHSQQQNSRGTTTGMSPSDRNSISPTAPNAGTQSSGPGARSGSGASGGASGGAAGGSGR